MNYIVFIEGFFFEPSNILVNDAGKTIDTSQLHAGQGMGGYGK